MPIREKPLKQDLGKKNILHAILFPKDKFTLNEAKKWLDSHNYNYIHNRQTKNIWRFRIKTEIRGYTFFTKVLPNGVEMVFMKAP